MADLSQVQSRITAVDKAVRHTDGIIPNRRDTDPGNRVIYGDMRNAARCDGGAEELRAMFGKVNQVAGQFGQLAQNRQDTVDAKNASQGALDSITGTADPELQRKSHAYQVAYSKGKAENDTLNFAQNTLQSDVEHLVTNGVPVTGPDGQTQEYHPATIEDVNQLIHQHLQDFLKPKGGDRDFGSPEAKAVVYQHLKQITSELQQKAAETIKVQVTDTSVKNATANLTTKVKAGLPTDFKEFRGQLVNVDDAHAAVYYSQSMRGVADELSKSVDPEDQKRAIAIGNMLSGHPGGVTHVGGGVTPGDGPVDTTKPYYTGTPKPVHTGTPMNREQVIEFTLKSLEGGDKVVNYSDGDGGTTKFGIAQKFAGPGVKVADLDFHGAAKIAREKYWFPELNKADPQVAAVAFDAGFIGGTSVGKRILASAGGDASKALGLYRSYLNKVADKNPDKEQYRKGWMNRVNRLAAKLGENVGDAETDIPVVAGSVPRPPSAEDMQAGTPNDGSVSDMTSLLTPEQRNSNNEWRTQLMKQIDETNQTHRQETYKATYEAVLGREMGIGGSPATVSEIQQLVTTGKLPVQEGMQIINARKQDAKEEAIAARQGAMEARQMALEEKQASRERVSDAADVFLSGVYDGKVNLGDAKSKLLVQSYTQFKDPAERVAFQKNVFGQLQMIKELRTGGSGYQGFMYNMENLGSELKGQIPQQIVGKPRIAIERFIDKEVAKAKVEGGRLGQDQGQDLDKYYDTLEKRMTTTFEKNRFGTMRPIVPRN